MAWGLGLVEQQRIISNWNSRLLVTSPMRAQFADFSSGERVKGTRVALKIARDVWALTDEECGDLLGMTADEIRALNEAPDRAAVTDDQLLRASYILGIHQALDTLTPQRAAHPAFVRRSLPALDGASPLEVMREGPNGLRRIRQWLERFPQW